MFINLKNVSRLYATDGGEPVEALRSVSFGIERGDFVAITGESGCGKSTLLHLLGALDLPTNGEIFVGENALHAMGERDRTRYRREDVGIVFQFFNLLPTMTVQENIALPLLLQGIRQGKAAPAAQRVMELTGITHRATHFPHQLSGGEMQRTAIARALVHSPALLLADEPTGNLDHRNAENILDLMKNLHVRQVATLVVVTHSDEVAAGAGSIINLDDH